MAISNELMLAILAMDACNRGYGAGLKVSGTQLGTAVLGRGTNEQTKPDAVAASFFAQAYTLSDDRTVISYRGTDVKDPGPGGDVYNGYGLALGSPYGAVARRAAALGCGHDNQIIAGLSRTSL